MSETRSARPDAVTAALGAVLLSILRPAALGAQEGGAPPDTAAAEPAYRAGEIRVSVARSEEALRSLPFPAAVVDAGEETSWERRASLAEVLEGVPGVLVQDRRNFSLGDRIVVRGAGARAQFGVRGVTVVADGVPLTLPDGQTTLTNLDLASADRVEVLRGPAAALYGNAAGGVIRVESGGFTDRPFAGEPALAFGSEGLDREEATAAGALGATRYVAAVSRHATDGWRDHSAAELYRANVLLRTDLAGEVELRAVVNAFRSPFSENPGSLDRDDALRTPRKARPFLVAQGTGEESTQLQGGISLRRPAAGERLGFRASAWGLTRDLRNPIPGRIVEVERTAGGARVELRGGSERDPRHPSWTAGLDIALQRDDRVESENLGTGGGGAARGGARLLDQRERVVAAGPFLRASVGLLAGLRLTGALRWDLVHFDASDRLLADGDDSGSRTLTSLSPTAGLTYDLARSLSLYGNVSTAFETPTTSELSNRPDGGGGLNPTLEPERTLSVELGVRGILPAARLRYELAAYASRVSDLLVPFQGPTEETFFRNAGRASRRGVEASAEWRPLPFLRTALAYTHQRNVFDRFVTPGGDLGGSREPGVPGDRLRLEAGGRWPSGLRAELSLTWTDAFPVDDANDHWNWSSRVVDLRLGWSGRAGALSLRPFLGVDNVFDERYNASVVPNAFGDRYYEPAPGRTLSGGLEISAPAGR